MAENDERPETERPEEPREPPSYSDSPSGGSGNGGSGGDTDDLYARYEQEVSAILKEARALLDTPSSDGIIKKKEKFEAMKERLRAASNISATALEKIQKEKQRIEDEKKRIDSENKELADIRRDMYLKEAKRLSKTYDLISDRLLQRAGAQSKPEEAQPEDPGGPDGGEPATACSEFEEAELVGASLDSDTQSARLDFILTDGGRRQESFQGILAFGMAVFSLGARVDKVICSNGRADEKTKKWLDWVARIETDGGRRKQFLQNQIDGGAARLVAYKMSSDDAVVVVYERAEPVGRASAGDRREDSYGVPG